MSAFFVWEGKWGDCKSTATIPLQQNPLQWVSIQMFLHKKIHPHSATYWYKLLPSPLLLFSLRASSMSSSPSQTGERWFYLAFYLYLSWLLTLLTLWHPCPHHSLCARACPSECLCVNIEKPIFQCFCFWWYTIIWLICLIFCSCYISHSCSFSKHLCWLSIWCRPKWHNLYWTSLLHLVIHRRIKKDSMFTTQSLCHPRA